MRENETKPGRLARIRLVIEGMHSNAGGTIPGEFTIYDLPQSASYTESSAVPEPCRTAGLPVPATGIAERACRQSRSMVKGSRLIRVAR